MTTSKTISHIKPSDANSWLECKRRVWLDNKADLKPVGTEDAFEQLVIDQGKAHEQAVLQRISETRTVRTAVSTEDTNRLIAERTPVIYQARLVDESNGITGFPDFLILHENGEYQAADAKLAQNQDKKDIKVQLGVYRRLLHTLHDSQLPAIVFLGNGEQAEIGDEVNQLTEKFITEMRELLNTEQEPSVHYGHSKCRACPYYQHCKPRFEAKAELSLLYGVEGRVSARLNDAGIRTISQLADSDPAEIPDVPYLKSFDKKQRAVLQAKSYLTGEIFQRTPITLPEGQWIHFDIEDNPLTGTGKKHVYLWGFLVPDSSDKHEQERFEYVWTDEAEEDHQGWLRFLAQIERYRQQYPTLILAHYTYHEITTIGSYAKRYGMEGNETVAYLLGKQSPLFDLQKPVLGSLVLPLQGYGLKDICKHPDLVNFQWQDEDSGSQWSVVQFNRFLSENDPDIKAALKAQILGYNQDDVTATHRLQQWLRRNYID